MINTKTIKKTIDIELFIFLLIFSCNFLLCIGFLEFLYRTPIGQSMNSIVSLIIFFSMFLYSLIIYPKLSVKYIQNKRSKFMEEHSDEFEALVKDVLPYHDDLCILVLYDGNTSLTFKTSLTPKWEKMMKESEQKRLDEENENG